MGLHHALKADVAGGLQVVLEWVAERLVDLVEGVETQAVCDELTADETLGRR